MCGFSGIWRFNVPSIDHDRSWLAKHLESMRYRGPDEMRVYDDYEGLLLGFNRLAIRDLSDFGSQPLRSKSGKIVACYNGETYNIDELIDQAGLDRSLLRGHSDTEVIVECVEKCGIRWVMKRADGIFALAIFDQKTKTLEIARDHLGIKPLYFGWQDDFCIFSSEYNPIIAHKDFCNGKVSADALQGYFQYGFIQEGEGLVEKTMFVPQGHILKVNSTGEWSLDSYDDGIAEIKKTLNKDELDNVLKTTIGQQLASDVPLGLFISGGVDSVLVGTYATSLSQEKLNGYTISVEDERLDESLAAKDLISMMRDGVSHTISLVRDREILQSLDDFESSMGEPLSDFSSLLMLQICKGAKGEVTVVLSGDGGDELFFGYPRFRHAYQLENFFRKSKLMRLLDVIRSRFGKNPKSIRLLKFDSFLEYYLCKQGVTGNQRNLKNILTSISPTYRPLHFGIIDKVNKGGNLMNKARLLEKKIHLQKVLLKVDRASMFHSLEVRVPLLSKKVVALSDFFTAEMSIDIFEESQKKPLKELLVSKLGKESFQIIHGRKRGFEPPLGKWLRNELKQVVADRIFSTPRSLKGFFNERGIRDMWAEHQVMTRDNSDAIWAVFSLFVWVEKHLGNEN